MCIEKLQDKLKSLDEFFKGGEEELGYLLLTGKPEQHIRDKIAFELQKDYKKDYEVAREWVSDNIAYKRFDLAVLNEDGSPEAVVEFKVGLSTDMLRGYDRKNILGDRDEVEEESGVLKDIHYLRKLPAECRVCAVLLLIHPSEKIGEEIEDVVKYSDKINRRFNDQDGQNPGKEIKEKSKEQPEEYREGADSTFLGPVSLQTPWDMKVELLSYIIKPGEATR